MSCLRLSFTDRRRARLARKFRLEQIEPRSLITDPLSLAGLSMGLPAVWGILGLTRASLLGNAATKGLPAAQGGSVTTGQANALAASQPPAQPLFVDQATLPLRIVPATGFAASASLPATGNPTAATGSADWLTFLPQGGSNPPSSGFGANWKPAPRAQGQLVVLGGSNGGSAASAAAPAASRGAISKLSFDPPLPSSGATAALMAAVSTPNNAPPPAAHGYGPTPAKAPAAQPAAAPAGGASAQPMAAGATVSGGAISPTSIADPTISNFSPASLGQFPYFPVYVINYNNGSIMMPGAYQLGTWSTGVDLRAQVEGTTVSSISWSTSGLVNAEDISGANTYDLKFGWGGTGNSSPTVNSVTLSVTDVNNHTETFTYDFLLPSGGGNYSPSGGGGATWPTSLAPNLELSQAPALASQNVSVDSTSGSLDTSINLPSYNPNVPALALTYDSLTADPRPIVEIPNALSSTLATPSQVSGQITVATTGGTTVYTGSTWYYNTSQFMPGDIQQIALQANMTGQSTGRYNYTATVVDYRTTNTTTTITGTETVLNQSTSAFGDGWNLEGLERITSASGGVILDLGSGGRTLWFTGSFGSSGGTYTDPPGEFSTLVENSGGGYTDTQTDGTQINFDSSGDETSVVNTNGLTTTLAWSGGTLNTITDPYHNITTFTYIGGYLQSIKDPANRITTFTHSGADLTGATLPDNSTWGYAYDSSGRLTQVTDPNSKTTTIAYDSAERASTITRPDGSIQTFFPNQEQGWTNTGTSGSPAAATLLALASSIYTDPNGNVTNQFPDWNGQGLTDVYIDALGNVSSYDRTSNGLATVTIDPLNRINQYTYDTHGNITQLTNPDLTTQQYSYNSFAEVTKYTDENNHTYTYTYDSHGNLLVSEDPLDNLTTMTYTPDGMLATEEDANKHTTDYSYDTQDRLTTVTNADGTTVLYGYNSQGNVTSTTNERGYTTTYSFDAMNRETGTTDALQDHTTFIYDSGGNLLVDEKPTPAGQTARTTSYSYDSMNRVVTVTAPMSQVTVSGYDSGGNLIKITDPMGRVTTISYDALNRPIVVTAPLTATTNAVTTTVYDADNEVIQVTDPMGRIRTTAYDNRGWVATVTDPLGNVTTYSYTNTGQISTQNNKYSYGNSIEAYYYDNDDRLTTFTDGMNDTTVYGYDSGGNETSVKDGNGNTTNYAYDSMNRLTTVTDALGHTTVYGYDSGGNQQTVTDGVGDVTTTLYDALNRATTIVDPRGDVTTIAYDVAGREVSLTDPNGNQTTWGYDAADRMTTMTDSLGHSATYVYNADDQLTDTTDRDGQRVTYSYDSGGQETGETWYNSSGGRTDLITSTYDADNELTSISDNYATLTFSYDSGGNQITAATSGPGAGQPSVTLTSGYDQDHDLTSIADNLSSPGLTTLQYDAAFRLTTITTSYGGTAGPQIVLGYDPGNRETSISRTVGGTGVSVNTTLAYDTANRLTTITDGSYTPGTGSGGGTSAALATYVYGYDNANRVTTEVDAEGTATFTYDSGGELLTARGSRTENYSYDSGGNRNMSGYTTGTGNELSSGGGYTFTYDKEGNTIGETQLSTGDVWTFGYDDRNRMISAVEKSSGGTTLNQATYTYDALDRRIGVDDNGTQTWTIYNGSSADANPYADFNGSGTLLTRYVSGLAVDELFARTSSGGATAWYLTDRLGSVRDIVNSSGTVIDHIVYDSYGNILSETSPSNGDRFKFAGMEWDAAIGQYYDHARWYGPTAGRFDEQDPIGLRVGSENLFCYVGNSPLNAVDHSGLYQSNQDSGNTSIGQGSNLVNVAKQQLQQAQEELAHELDCLAYREFEYEVGVEGAWASDVTAQEQVVVQAQRKVANAKLALAIAETAAAQQREAQTQEKARMIAEQYDQRLEAKEIQRWIDYYQMIQTTEQSFFGALFGSQAAMAQASADAMNAAMAAMNKARAAEQAAAAAGQAAQAQAQRQKNAPPLVPPSTSAPSAPPH